MWNRNITGLDAEGTFRSLNGAADENVFIGKLVRQVSFAFSRYGAICLMMRCLIMNIFFTALRLKALRLVHITSLEEADLAHRLIVMQKTEPEGSKEAIVILLFALIVITEIVTYYQLIFWI